MKRNIKNMAFALLTLFAVTSCDLLEIDNYDGPNATIEGKILDIETGELVEQDIIDGIRFPRTIRRTSIPSSSKS